MQDQLGAARDMAQGSALVEKLEIDPCLAALLRGVSVGAARQ
jgi:hypothetical protein